MRSSCNEYEIEPPDRAGPITLGMARDTVRTIIGEPFSANTESFTGMERDVFHDAGIIARYHPDTADALLEIEFGYPARVTLLGIPLLERNWEDLRPELEQDGFLFRDCGTDTSIKRCPEARMSLWVPVDDVESVSLSPFEPDG
jgi:hypothetical protein